MSNLPMFVVKCDPNAKSNGSSKIITDSINFAAKNLGLYCESGVKVFYDCLCQTHNCETDVIWSAYELPFPPFLINSLGGKPMLGLSRDNAMMAIAGGYPRHLVDFVSLGVDSSKWKYCYRQGKKNGDPFTFLCACESNTRSAFEDLVPIFCNTFSNNSNVRLYIKDRNATDKFKEWVRKWSIDKNVDILHDDRDIESIEDQLEIYSKADFFVCINHSHTFGMNRLQALSCGVPIITTYYQGGREYLNDFCGYAVDYTLSLVDEARLQLLVDRVGLKNHLLPVKNSVNQSFWASINKNFLAEAFLKAKNLNRDQIMCASDNARRIAEWFSWERSAVNMAAVLKQWLV